MMATRSALILASGVALAAWGGNSSAGEGHAHGKAAAGEAAGHSHERSELHGGHATMTENHHFETVFEDGGIRVYVYSGTQEPAALGKAAGAVTLKWKDGATREVPLVAKTPKPGEAAVYFCPMGAEFVGKEPGRCPKCGMNLVAQDYLFAAADLSKAEPGSLKAVVRLKGLGRGDPEATFTETYRGAAAQAATPAKPAAHKDSPSHSHTH